MLGMGVGNGRNGNVRIADMVQGQVQRKNNKDYDQEAQCIQLVEAEGSGKESTHVDPAEDTHVQYGSWDTQALDMMMVDMSAKVGEMERRSAPEEGAKSDGGMMSYSGDVKGEGEGNG